MSAIRIVGGLALGLAAVAAVAPLVVPLPELTDTVAPEALADPDSRFLDVDLSGADVRVHYKSAGTEGPAIMLLHGFAASLFTWQKVMEPLGDVGRVVAYDRPAFGLTSRPMAGEWRGESPYGPSAQVELALTMLDRLGVERAILVGHSAGGTVALQLALERPERVEGLILVDPAVYVGGGGPDWLKPLFDTPQMRRLGPTIVRSLIGGLERQGFDLAWHDRSKVTVETVEGYRNPLRAENWDRGLWELVRATSSAHLAERLGEVTVPTLVITGDDDRVVPTAQSQRLARELPNARLVVIPSCGHVPQEECPEAFIDAARGFVAELSSATAG